jgi:proline dehydrogenase
MFSRFLFTTFRRPPPNWPRLRSIATCSARRLALLGTLPAGYMILNGDDTLQVQNPEPSPSNPHRQPLTALARSYVVYSLCSIPAIVDYAPSLLDFIGRIPILNHVAYSLIKITFFDQVGFRLHISVLQH